MSTPTPIDTLTIRQAYPLAEIVEQYGVALTRRGPILMGRCPLHDDHTPSFLVDERDQHYHCFGCGAHGDVIGLMRRLERLDFRGAVARLTGASPPPARPPARVRTRPEPERPGLREDPEASRCLAAAIELYRNQFLARPAALAYLRGRGLARETLERWQVGYAAGDTLLPYLCWRRLSPMAARRAGLFDRTGHERLAGRIVFPEIRAGRTCWLIGRIIAPDQAGPKYLGLPGRKPLLGWDAARSAAHVVVVEGVVDLLVLGQWGIPAVALAGTHASSEQRNELQHFPSVSLALDADDAGQQGVSRLATALPARSRLVAIPAGAKDVADLATRPDGRAAFLDALEAAESAVAA
jgi:DNA primase